MYLDAMDELICSSCPCMPMHLVGSAKMLVEVMDVPKCNGCIQMLQLLFSGYQVARMSEEDGRCHGCT